MDTNQLVDLIVSLYGRVPPAAGSNQQLWMVVVAGVVQIVALVVGLWKITGKVDQVHTQINSRMTDLLLLTKNASHAEGVKEGTHAQRVVELAEKLGTPPIATTSVVPLTEDRLIEILNARDKATP